MPGTKARNVVRSLHINLCNVSLVEAEEDEETEKEN